MAQPDRIISFNPESGEYIENFGGQGLSADSAWSRGVELISYHRLTPRSFAKKLRMLYSKC
jgi:hypothetical protein